MRLEIEKLRPMSMADDPTWGSICEAPVRRGLTAAMFIGSSKSSEADSSSAPASHSFGCPCCVPPRLRNQTVNAGGKEKQGGNMKPITIDISRRPHTHRLVVIVLVQVLVLVVCQAWKKVSHG
jgi:hypothetical protein